MYLCYNLTFSILHIWWCELPYLITVWIFILLVRANTLIFDSRPIMFPILWTAFSWAVPFFSIDWIGILYMYSGYIRTRTHMCACIFWINFVIVIFLCTVFSYTILFLLKRVLYLTKSNSPCFSLRTSFGTFFMVLTTGDHMPLITR